MTARQSVWLFTGATIKTVDDHCGYALPFDPLQHITSNNAGYHDVHHQSWGIKTNFSQPFFTFWDGFLGTKWVGGDVSARYERARNLAQKKADADSVVPTSVSEPITHSEPSQSVSANPSPYEQDWQNADPDVKNAHSKTLPHVPAGKATQQAVGSRQQVVDDMAQPRGGFSVLKEETAEEREAQRSLRRSPRKKSMPSASGNAFAPMKEIRDRVNTSLRGKGSAVLGVESSR